MTTATVTITAENQTKVYGTADPTFTYQVSGLVGSDTLVTDPTCTPTGDTNFGTYAINCTGADAGSNYTIDYVAGSFSVTTATVTITAENQTKVYGTADPTFTYQVSGLVGSDTLVTDPTCTPTGDTNFGTYAINCTGADAGSNYTIDYVAGSFSVTTATVTITAENQTRVHGTADPTFTYQVSGLVGSDTLVTDPTCTPTGDTNFGTYAINCTGADAGSNYTIDYVAGSFSVTTATVTITAENQTKVYGTADPTFTYQVSGLVGSDTLVTDPTCTPTGDTNFGTYAINCTGADAGSNYTIDYVAGSFSVTTATVTITAENQTKVYGTADPTFTYQVSGLVGSDTLVTDPTCTPTGDTNFGTYAINCTGADAGSNYTIDYVAGSFSVTTATVTITAENQTKVYGTADPTFTYQVSGLVGSDTLVTDPTCTPTGDTNFGTYAINCTGADAGSNYTIDYVAGSFSVTTATVTITAENQTKVYGTADPTFTYQVSGLVGSDTLVTDPTCTPTGDTNFGTYAINCTGADAGSNYTIDYVAGSFSVTTATVTIAAENQTKVYGTPTRPSPTR